MSEIPGEQSAGSAVPRSGTSPGSTAADVQRPDACPKPGQVQAFDAGWEAHEKGISRESVRVFTNGNGMALLAWDIREAEAYPDPSIGREEGGSWPMK